MKSRKFPTLADAKAYLEERGKVDYHGAIGQNPEYYCYTLTVGSLVWMVDIYEDGLLVVRGQRYKE